APPAASERRLTGTRRRPTSSLSAHLCASAHTGPASSAAIITISPPAATFVRLPVFPTSLADLCSRAAGSIKETRSTIGVSPRGASTPASGSSWTRSSVRSWSPAQRGSTAAGGPTSASAGSSGNRFHKRDHSSRQTPDLVFGSPAFIVIREGRKVADPLVPLYEKGAWIM